MAVEQYWGTGRRKTSVARVRVIPEGSGQFVVNKKPIETYFDRDDLIQLAKQPTELTDKSSAYDVFVNTRGAVSRAKPVLFCTVSRVRLLRQTNL